MKNQINAWQKWIKVLDEELSIEMAKAPSPSEIHAKDHILRVLKWCIELGKKLEADLEVVVAAAYLHDLGRHYINSEAHGGLGAEKALPVLERIGFPPEKRAAVLLAIKVHDVAAIPEDRTSLESKILYDADKIDALGVVGILRYIRRLYGRISMDAILADLDDRWNGLALPETKELCRKDYEYIKDYFMRLKTALSTTDNESWRTEK